MNPMNFTTPLRVVDTVIREKVQLPAIFWAPAVCLKAVVDRVAPEENTADAWASQPSLASMAVNLAALWLLWKLAWLLII